MASAAERAAEAAAAALLEAEAAEDAAREERKQALQRKKKNKKGKNGATGAKHGTTQTRPPPPPPAAESSDAESDSHSDSDSDSDDGLAAMLSFVGDREALKARERELPMREDEVTRATRELTRKYRAEQQQAKSKEKRNALKELTMRNLAAASSLWLDEEEAPVAAGGQEGVQAIPAQAPADEASAHAAFTRVVKEGQRLILGGELEAAVAALKDGIPICQAFPGRVAWAATLHMTIGQTLVKLGRVRDGAQHLLNALHTIRRQSHTSFDSRPLQRQILTGLVHALEDIGKMEDAETWRKELVALERYMAGDGAVTATSTSEKSPSPPPQAAGADQDQDRALPKPVRDSLDVALETAVNGQFGMLRAILHAFRQGRGDVSLAQVVRYAHSKTGATPLMLAATHGELRLVGALLAAGAPLGQTSSDDSTALEWAARFDQPAAVRMLLDAGAVFDSGLSADLLSSWSPGVQQAIAEFVQSRKAAPEGSATGSASEPSDDVKKDKPQGKSQGKPQGKSQGKPQGKSQGKPQGKSHGSSQSKPQGKPQSNPPSKPQGKPQGKGGPRELEKWTAEEATAAEGVAGGSLEGASGDTSVGQDWDQFAANKELGVKESGFDENLYTTRLDVDSIPAEVREQAEKLAKSMEKSREVAETDYADEEAAFSSVARQTDGAADDGWTDASVLRKGNRRGGNKPKRGGNK